MNQPELYALMRPRKICICRQVSEEEIRQAVQRDGARDFEGVQTLTGCSTGCGTCESSVRAIIARSLPTPG